MNYWQRKSRRTDKHTITQNLKPLVLSRIPSLLNIRANETRTAALLIGIMLFSAAGYSLGGTGIEALYFARYGTDLLPYLYMGLGFLSLITTLTITGLLGRVKRERMYVLVPMAAAGFILIAWGLLFIENPLIYPALWLWLTNSWDWKAAIS